MKNSRNVVLGVIAVLLVGTLALAGFLATRSSTSSTESNASENVRSASSRTSQRTTGVNAADLNTSTAASGLAQAADGSSSSDFGSSNPPSGDWTSAPAPSSETPETGSSSTGGTSSPSSDRGVWGPAVPIVPDGGVAWFAAGPTLSSPIWTCGSKVIVSITAEDPNGVVSVWGSYYIDGSKHSFTAATPGSNVWSATILNWSFRPVTGLVVYAKDGLGNNSSLSVATLCA